MSSTLNPDLTDAVAPDAFSPLNGGLRWHDSAPRRVAGAGDWSNGSEGWKRWQKHLARRKRPQPIARLFRHHQLSPLPVEIRDGGDREDFEEALAAWLDLAASQLSQLSIAEGAVALARELPRLAKHLSARLWWSTLDWLLQARLWAQDQRWDSEILAGQLLLTELPLTLAYLMPELDNCRALVPGAIEHLRASMQELLDGQGLVHASHLNSFPSLVACWSRCRRLCASMDRAKWTGDMRRELSAAVVHVLRLTRRNGSRSFDSVSPPTASIDWLKDHDGILVSRKAQRLAAFVLNGKEKTPTRMPPAADHSEWSEMAVMRNDWSSDSSRLIVDYGARRVRAEFAAGTEPLLSGLWNFEVRWNRNLLSAQTDWEQTCWESDKECDYLELETTLGHGVIVQRQFVLSRRDDIFVVADAVIASEPGEIEYRATFPLAAATRFEPAEETREGTLVGRKRRARVLPLALPEWRADPRGSLQVVDGQLELAQSASHARGLYAPLFFDLRPRRFGKRLTWRRLTVAEEHVVQGVDVAAGFRVHIGKEQWLIYRSLHQGRSRTVLGHHLFSEYLVGRFTTEGTVEPVIEIE
ncbi:MAG TPA: hypothetical protein VHV77_09635 [Pirellulales bacterium]|jgi:hypothetical protein|nr:hypothetical protein [Pirellulales bacterium]